MQSPRILLSALALATATSCGREPSASAPTPLPAARPRKTVVELAPLAPDFRAAAGQTIYVPAYSSIFVLDRARPFDLAITLSVRNADRANPIILTSVRYYDHDGQLVRDYLKAPLRIGPLASTEYFVTESDTSGGISASFLVEWVGEQPVASPVVESVMIGAASTQGIALTCPGRVLTDRNPAAPRAQP